MASGITNRGRLLMGQWAMQGITRPTTFYLALATDAATPTVDTNTWSQLTEVPAGNGYTANGIALTANSTNFPWSEDDTNDRARCDIPDQTWTASGGNLPASGNGARWAVLMDDNVTVGSRQVVAWWDLVSNRIVSTGQPLTLQNLIMGND